MTESITRPTLILDVQKMKSNIDRIISKASRLGVQLVPHFKTHQSKQVGEYFRQAGVDAITVSSVAMAEYFVQHGWKDVTIAFPFNRLETNVINGFVKEGVKVKLLITDVDTVAFLRDHLEGPIDLFIELDAGYHRSGVSVDKFEEVAAIAQAMEQSEKTSFYGLYCHPGNTYHEDTVEGIKSLWSHAIRKVNEIRKGLESIKSSLIIRMGDTPGCSVVEDMVGVDQIGPGNFVFYDLVMNYLNVCEETDIAVAVACPIVAKNRDRKEVVIHGGAVHFSKDHLFDEEGHKFFGEVVIFEEGGWSKILPESKLVSISQEHGILKVPDDLFNILNVGDVLGVLPIHSCLTANLMRQYTTLSGDQFEHV